MIIFIEIVVALGLIAFPIIISYFKGTLKWCWAKGFVVGVNYDSMFFMTEIEGVRQPYKLHSFQFHVACLSLALAFSLKRDDIKIEE